MSLVSLVELKMPLPRMSGWVISPDVGIIIISTRFKEIGTEGKALEKKSQNKKEIQSANYGARAVVTAV